jgi:hypothetical protein
LGGPGWKHPPPLNRLQIIIVGHPAQKLWPEDVCGRNRILDRQIYSDAADRGHGMSRVTDA